MLTTVMFQLIMDTIVDVLWRLRNISEKKEMAFGHTQYCRGLYPWNEPVSFILAT
jgi:hypothetical protein